MYRSEVHLNPSNLVNNVTNASMEVNVTKVSGIKRHRDVSEGPPLKKAYNGLGFTISLQALTRAAELITSGSKSPVSALNELGVKVAYNLLDYRGPAHCPSFTISVTVANQTFKGHGTSKRDARAQAARNCIESLLATAGQVLPDKNQQDFSSDLDALAPSTQFQNTPSFANGIQKELSSAKTTLTEIRTSPPLPVETLSPFTPTQALPTANKSPINVLYESFPGVTFHTTFGDGTPIETENACLSLHHSMRFKTVCTVNDKCFEGYGSSKKQAKLAASRSAIASLMCMVPASDVENCVSTSLPQHLADHVSKLVTEKFNELMRNDPVHLKRKVLAGIVMTVDNQTEKSKIIAVSTGTKCVSGEYMSVTGRAVNDCHAEVVARRCLQRYLYHQLLMYAQSENPRKPIEDSDLTPLPEGGYKLKENRQIHLYISTAPCGDGRIFSPHETKAEPDRHPNRFSRGQLRSKIESGEGTIPVKRSAFIQTWDGVLQGERLLTMSCSDKLARWCVTGVQGALLSRILKPVYLTSVVLGSLLHPGHMYR
ncbi:unnamed protein product [Leptosia nina]|uniref:Double-stranded RNA-specific editase Adar n=1 Tax=Leptosia nina TaxID=320188 RepID=A0AAV1K373_9NEOP